jgi:hypothetical protein
MAITRTPIIDDDGTGTTGTVIDNAWKTELYNQIDAAAAAGGPTYGSWTPIDASAGALSLSVTSASWAKLGRLVWIWVEFAYPATADTNIANLAGLPFPVRSPLGGSQGFGPTCQWYFTIGAGNFQPLDPATSGLLSNAQMSGRSVRMNAVYFTD